MLQYTFMSIEKSGPNFNYDQTGLEITIHDIRSGVYSESRSVLITDIPHTDPHHESYGRVLTAIENSRNEKGIGFTLIPPMHTAEAGIGKLTVYQYPWSGYTDSLPATSEMAAYAAAMPTHTILAIDNPATGRSDPLPRSVAHKIGKTGSYLPYAEIMISTLRKVLEDYDEINFSGASQGARRAIACAAFMGMCLDLTTNDLRVIDPVGSHKQSLRELAKGFMVDMAGNSRRYVEASTDTAAAERQKRHDSPTRVAAGLWDLIRRHGVADQFLHQPRALAQDGLEADLRKAFPYITDTLAITSPELSELTRPGDVRHILQEVSRFGSGPQHIEYRVLNGQTHALFAGHPGTLGVLLSDKPAA